MKNLITNLLTFTIKTGIVFLFISVFIFNLQIQTHDIKGNLTGFIDIVQVDLFINNLQAYFLDK